MFNRIPVKARKFVVGAIIVVGMALPNIACSGGGDVSMPNLQPRDFSKADWSGKDGCQANGGTWSEQYHVCDGVAGK